MSARLDDEFRRIPLSLNSTALRGQRKIDWFPEQDSLEHQKGAQRESVVEPTGKSQRSINHIIPSSCDMSLKQLNERLRPGSHQRGVSIEKACNGIRFGAMGSPKRGTAPADFAHRLTVQTTKSPHQRHVCGRGRAAHALLLQEGPEALHDRFARADGDALFRSPIPSLSIVSGGTVIVIIIGCVVSTVAALGNVRKQLLPAPGCLDRLILSRAFCVRIVGRSFGRRRRASHCLSAKVH